MSAAPVKGKGAPLLVDFTALRAVADNLTVRSTASGHTMDVATYAASVLKDAESVLRVLAAGAAGGVGAGVGGGAAAAAGAGTNL